MKSIKFVSLAVMSIMAVASFGAQADVKRSLTGAYAKMDALTMKMDSAGLTKLLLATSTPDCIFVEGGMKHTRSEMIDRMKVNFASLNGVTESTSHVRQVVHRRQRGYNLCLIESFCRD